MADLIRPDYYGGQVQPWDLWKDLDPFMASILKRAFRAGKKPGNSYGQDVRKIITEAQKALEVYGEDGPSWLKKE